MNLQNTGVASRSRLIISQIKHSFLTHKLPHLGWRTKDVEKELTYCVLTGGDGSRKQLLLGLHSVPFYSHFEVSLKVGSEDLLTIYV